MNSPSSSSAARYYQYTVRTVESKSFLTSDSRLLVSALRNQNDDPIVQRRTEHLDTRTEHLVTKLYKSMFRWLRSRSSTYNVDAMMSNRVDV